MPYVMTTKTVLEYHVTSFTNFWNSGPLTLVLTWTLLRLFIIFSIWIINMLVQSVHEVQPLQPVNISKKDKRFLCDVCCKQFQHKGNLNSHMRSHTGERPYSCDVCEKRFSTSGILKTHMRTHTGEKPYLCDTCGKRFSHIGILKNHMLTHSGERPHRCPVPDCGKDYSRAANLKIHMRSHTGERPFRCDFPECDWTFVSSADLKVHHRSHTGERPYLCNVGGCGKEFSHSRDLKNHMFIHNNGNRPFRCDEENCCLEFSRASDLKRHQLRHSKDKPFKCDWFACEGEFSRVETLRAHQRMHTGQKPFACALCPAMFSALAKLKVHIKGHNTSTTEEPKPYKCAECHRKFSQPRNLHRHMVLSHGDTSGPFTVTLMSPERIPFNDCNGQFKGQKRPLPEDARKSAFTPVSKSPCLSPSYTLPTSNTLPLTPPTYYQPQRTGLSITNVKSLRQEPSPSFSDIGPLSDDSRSPPSKMKFVKKEQLSPRHHPYNKKIAPKPMPHIAPRPEVQPPLNYSPQNYMQASQTPSPATLNFSAQTFSPTTHTNLSPTSLKIAHPAPISAMAPMHPQVYRPIKCEPRPELQLTVVHQLQCAAIATSFDMMVRARQAYQTYQTMKCFYKSIDMARKTVSDSQMEW